MANDILTSLMIVAELAILEGLLSLDNALVLAACVKKNLSDSIEQKKALLYGLVGAYIFRVLAILLGVKLFHYPWIQVVVGIYLIVIAIKELFFFRKNSSHEIDLKIAGSMKQKLSQRKIFWLTILNIEMLDFMFSIDSIAVALALSNELWVLISGAVLGILMMRFAAQYFVKLITRFPLLQKCAFILLGLAGINVLFKYAKATAII